MNTAALNMPDLPAFRPVLPPSNGQEMSPLTPNSVYSDVTKASTSSTGSKKPKRRRKYTYQCREISSFKVFNTFVNRFDDGTCDASGIVSPECYAKWVESRRKMPKKPEEAFRRALTAHCRGVDGRRPFSPEVEAGLLKELRKKKQWRCFENLPNCGSIGVQGFPSLGYHERLEQQKKVAQDSNAPSQANLDGSSMVAKNILNGYPGMMNGPPLAWDYNRYNLANTNTYLPFPSNNMIMQQFPQGSNAAQSLPFNFGLKMEYLNDFKGEGATMGENERRASAVFTKNILGCDLNSGAFDTHQLDPFY